MESIKSTPVDRRKERLATEAVKDLNKATKKLSANADDLLKKVKAKVKPRSETGLMDAIGALHRVPVPASVTEAMVQSQALIAKAPKLSKKQKKESKMTLKRLAKEQKKAVKIDEKKTKAWQLVQQKLPGLKGKKEAQKLTSYLRRHFGSKGKDLTVKEKENMVLLFNKGIWTNPDHCCPFSVMWLAASNPHTTDLKDFQLKRCLQVECDSGSEIRLLVEQL